MIKKIGLLRKYRVFIFLTLLVGLSHPVLVQAQEGEPRRQEFMNIVYTEYDWWLVHWQNNKTACEIKVDHEEEPTGAEIYQQCGKKIYDMWQISDPCSAADSGDQGQCGGMYLFLGWVRTK